MKPKFRFTYFWSFDDGVTGGSVQANTCGEARSLIKKLLGIPKKKRLPICEIRRQDNKPASKES